MFKGWDWNLLAADTALLRHQQAPETSHRLFDATVNSTQWDGALAPVLFGHMNCF